MIGKTIRTQEGKIINLSKNYSQYLALGLGEEFELPIALWLDYDERNQREILVHSFNVIGEQICVDSLGFFGDINERASIYPHTHRNIVICRTATETRDILKNLKVPHTNVEIKRAVRDKVRTQWLSMNIEINGVINPIAFWSESEFMGKPAIFFFTINENGHISKLIHKLPVEQFRQLKKTNLRFIDRKDYIGLGAGEIIRKL